MVDDEITPRVDQWYLDSRKYRAFTIIDFDEEEGSIEIQYFDGEVDALDMEEWEGMSLEEIDQPEDWTGPIEAVEDDDLGYDET